MKRSFSQYIFIVLIALFFVAPVFVFAAGESPLDQLPGIDLRFNDVYCIFLRVMTWLFSFALVLAIIMLIVNGLRYIFSGGSPEAVAKAHTNFAWIAVGIGVVLLSVSILLIIANFLGVFTASFKTFILPGQAFICEIVWWAKLISDVFSFLGI